MQVVVFGAKGMLGHDVMAALSQAGITAIGVDKAECDITDRAAVLAVVNEHHPTHIVNCAAYTNVDQAEDDRAACFAVNTAAVEHLTAAANQVGARIIQVSTDYVFNGQEPSYAEDAPHAPLNVYGESKAAGEQHVMATARDYQIVRTAWIFGHHGKNFVSTIAGKAAETDTLKVVNDQIGNPTATADLADQLVKLLTMSGGIYHVTNTGSCSWFEFATEIVRLTGHDCVVEPCTSAEYPTRVTRPAYSVLENTKLPPLRSWQEALKAYLGV